MPPEDYLSDDFVASLLSKDAKDGTIKYSACGLQGLLPKRPTTNAPRPNTRFLKNIIRETDNHNATLKAREVEESRARLRKLRHGPDSINDTSNHRRNDHRRQVVEDDRHRKRRRLDTREDEDLERRPRHSERRMCSYEKRNESRRVGRKHSYRHRRREVDEHEPESDQSDRYRRRHRRSRKYASRSRSRDRSRSRSQSRIDYQPEQRISKERRVEQRRSRSETRQRDYGDRRVQRKKRRSQTSPSQKNSPPQPSHESSKTCSLRKSGESSNRSPSDAESDPLDTIIGPAPPPRPPKVRPRGRGKFASPSAIDSHFFSNYDPTVDIHPNSGSEDDWDQALEALRDRQRWKQQGADRLRSAGFTEEEVSKWETGGEKREEDVKWRGPGEGREWDRGKVVDEYGGVDTKPEWGRLKGT